MLLSGPIWKSQTIDSLAPIKRPVTLFYQDAVDCIQSLLSHPFFKHHISFIPCKVWSTATQVVRVYNEWLTRDHAGNSRSIYDVKYIVHTLTSSQSQLPKGATLLGVILSSDKTNISVMSSNCMAHPLLLSLINIDTDIRSKGSLHGFLHLYGTTYVSC